MYLNAVDAVTELDGPAGELPDPPSESADRVVVVVIVVVVVLVARSELVASGLLQKHRILKRSKNCCTSFFIRWSFRGSNPA